MILTALLVLLLLLLLSVPVAATMVILGFTLEQIYSSFPLYRAMGEVFWSAGSSFLLIAIPLFVLIGEILVRAGIAERTYRSLETWLSWLPGGLLHANIGTAMLFSATSGSSVATAATVATVAMPQGEKLGYDARLFAGTIAGGGTLGILIPPSINLIVYGFLTETSVPRLFLAGLVPGLLLALIFMLAVAVICILYPRLGGPQRHFAWGTRLSYLVYLVPVLLLFVVIVGSIYLGWATPTEAAALGVVGAMALAAANRTFSFGMMREALEGTMKTTAMIMLIMTAAYFLNFILSAVGLTREITSLLEQFELGAYGTLFIIILLYIVLGFFVETLSLMVITIPIVAPIAFSFGFDPVWFGILLIVLIEMALITPPVGLNLYVVQGVRTGGSLNEVMAGAIPFVLCMLLMVGLLIVFPQLALFLPQLMN